MLFASFNIEPSLLSANYLLYKKMEDQIKHILSPLKALTPDEAFLARSRQFILTLPQDFAPETSRNRFFEGVRFGVALTFAALLFIVALGGVSYLGTSSPSVANSLNTTTLSTEAQDASTDFLVQIKEANYFSDSASRVASALEEISENGDKKDQEKK